MVSREECSSERRKRWSRRKNEGYRQEIEFAKVARLKIARVWNNYVFLNLLYDTAFERLYLAHIVGRRGRLVRSPGRQAKLCPRNCRGRMEKMQGAIESS